MKVIHVLKRIEMIEEDIRELKKMEKLLMKNKSFTTPIYMSIEKQINILLGEKIKLIELEIKNPPANMAGAPAEEDKAPEPIAAPKPAKTAPAKKEKQKKSKPKKEAPLLEDTIEDDDDEIHLLTQDQIDVKIKTIEEKSRHKKDADETDDKKKDSDEHVKLLDIALEKGTLNKSDVELEKKKVRFFKDNFPGKDY